MLKLGESAPWQNERTRGRDFPGLPIPGRLNDLAVRKNEANRKKGGDSMRGSGMRHGSSGADQLVSSMSRSEKFTKQSQLG